MTVSLEGIPADVLAQIEASLDAQGPTYAVAIPDGQQEALQEALRLYWATSRRAGHLGDAVVAQEALQEAGIDLVAIMSANQESVHREIEEYGRPLSMHDARALTASFAATYVAAPLVGHVRLVVEQATA